MINAGGFCMKRMLVVVLVTGLLSSAVLMSGCTKKEKTVTGAVIGAGAGVGLGSATGGTGGAVAGGLLGGIAGGLLGNSLGDDEEEK
jgi:hypothetical protein